MSVATEPSRPDAWTVAVRVIARWVERGERVDELLEAMAKGLSGTERARCQHLVFGVMRHFGRIEAALGRLVAHPPRFSTRAVLFVAGFELIDALSKTLSDGRPPKIVHHAVEQTKRLASPAEARLVNAVVRKLATELGSEPPPKLASAEALAEYFSHPVWLVRSWLAQFGAEATRALLEWNQQPAPVYARWRGTRPVAAAAIGKAEEVAPAEKVGDASSDEPDDKAADQTAADRMAAADATAANDAVTENVENAAAKVPEGEAVAAETNEVSEPVVVEEAPPVWFKPTQWAGFWEIPAGRWAEVEPLLKSGKIYLQDPATRIAVELLGLQETEVVLDACAAPGGKSLLIADTLRHGKVIAMDLPGPRIERLTENLSRFPRTVGVALVQADLRENATAVLKEHGLPREFRAVLLDVPCSNTGVMRHRVDVKWRLQEGDFKKHPRQQLALLIAAARMVGRGGRLVYSTCSVDAEENEEVVKAFLTDRHGQWTLESKVLSRPWETGHDGAGAFLLRRL